MDELRGLRGDELRAAEDRAIERMIKQATTVSHSARHTSERFAELHELIAAFMAHERAAGVVDRSRQYVIHEEPEFVWETDGSNPEPEAPRPLNPR